LKVVYKNLKIQELKSDKKILKKAKFDRLETSKEIPER
jgi:hypothetical protein